ncbi:MAG TPA: hypothetical protein VF540_02480, partial [Segetibacter sp.]
MKFPIKIVGLIAVLIISFANIYSQNSDVFASGGGFKLNLPKSASSSKDIAFNDGKLSGEGKAYTWEKPQAYFVQALYYVIDTEKKTLSLPEKTALLNPMKDALLKEAKEKNFPYTEKEYSFNGNKGIELQILYSGNPGGKSIARFFIVGKRFFHISTLFNRNQDETDIVRIMDSFSLLDSKSLIAAKIEEATPNALPQEPVVAKLKTDAQDKNLKGKVKSIIEENQDSSSKKRERETEEYYNELGNLTKRISFNEDYPSDVTIWGYIDGQRVLKSNYINFDDDQRPPLRRMIITASAENNVKNPNLPKDTRYSVRKTYKYNEKGQLIEEQTHNNNGEIWSRNVFNYKGNEREELHYGQNGAQWSRTIEILDKDGNVIERNLMDAQDKIDSKIISTYEYDAQGNWIVKK